MKRVLLFLALIIVALVVGVYCYLDSIVKTAIENYGTEVLGVDVKVESVHLMLPEEVTIKGLMISNPQGFQAPHSVNAGHIMVKMPIKSLFQDLIHIDEIIIDEPHLFYENNQNIANLDIVEFYGSPNALNFSVLQYNAAKHADSKNNEPGSNLAHPQKKIIVSHLLINQGKVTFYWNGAIRQSVTLPNIDMANIGQNEHGITIASASAKVLKEVASTLMKMHMKTVATEMVDKISKILGQ